MTTPLVEMDGGDDKSIVEAYQGRAAHSFY